MHGLFWLHDAPDVSKLSTMTDEERAEVASYFDRYICADHPDPTCPRADYHPCRKCPDSIGDVKQDLAELLNRVQMHSCNKSYCLRYNKTTKKVQCRFKFPHGLQDKSEIKLNGDGVYEFFPKRNVDCLNKFHKELIQVWRANMDISPILSHKALVSYLAKYVSKSETKSATLKEFLSNCATDDKSASSLIQKLLIRCCSERDYSAQEVCHLLMGRELVISSRDFVTVYMGKDSKWTEWDGAGPKGQSVLEKYISRSETLQNISLFEAAQGLILPAGRKRTKKAVVRVIPKLSYKHGEGSNEDFFRQQALLQIPWREEAALKGENETWENVCSNHNVGHVPCNVNLPEGRTMQHLLSEARQVDEEFEDEEPDISENITAEEFMVASAMLPNAKAQKIELGRRDIDLNHDWNVSAEKYSQYGSVAELRTFISQKKTEIQQVAQTACIAPDVTFNDEQKAVINLINDQIGFILAGSSGKSPPKRVIVQGKAGTFINNAFMN